VSILGKLFSASASQPIEAVGTVLDQLFTSDDERLEKSVLLERLARAPQLAQAEIEKVQAQHRSVWVAGARPAVVWVCAVLGLGAYRTAEKFGGKAK
jgi:hypothetical protein